MLNFYGTSPNEWSSKFQKQRTLVFALIPNASTCLGIPMDAPCQCPWRLCTRILLAVCCMAGSFTTPPSLDYSPTPILNVVGKEDSIMPYEGFYEPNYGLMYPDVQDSFETLSDLNGCSSRAQQETMVPDMTVVGGHKGKVVTDRAFDCWNDATVEFITLTTAGHSLYPTMTEERFPHFAARTTVDTTSMAWNFCKVHSLPEEPILSMAPTVAPTPSPTAVHSTTIISSAAALGPQWRTIWLFVMSSSFITFF